MDVPAAARNKAIVAMRAGLVSGGVPVPIAEALAEGLVDVQIKMTAQTGQPPGAVAVPEAMVTQLLDRVLPDWDATGKTVRPKGRARRRATKYSPDEPRDERGQWTDGGGSSATDGGYRTGSGQAPRVGMGDVSIKPSTLADLRQSTAGPYLTADGHFTPERQALHDRIVSNALAGTTPVEHPSLTMMGGGPASGKSSMVDSGAVALPDNAVRVDPDGIKNQIPEVGQMQAAGNPNWAAASHEESSYIASRVQAAAYETDRNVVLDTTGDSSAEKIGSKIDAAHNAGFTVNANYITVDPEAAVQRAADRAASTGRVVPESVIRSTYQGISSVFPQVANRFDTVNLFDNNGPKGSTPSLIGSKAAGGTFTVSNQAAYDRFLSYGR